MINEGSFTNIPAKFKQEFLQAYKEDAVSHAYLFLGSDEKTTTAAAIWLSCLFLCEHPDEDLRPDGTCANCRRVSELNHPDVFLVTETEKQSIGIDTVRPLKIELAKSPTEGDRRFFIISDAQKLTMSAANALLNVLEEPVAPVLTILTTTNVNQILPTIKSRVQIVNVTDEFKNEAEQDKLQDDQAELAPLAERFYTELMENNPLAILTAKTLADSAKQKELQQFVLDYLLQQADREMLTLTNIKQNQELLSELLHVNKMIAANVSFSSCLQYLILNIEF